MYLRCSFIAAAALATAPLVASFLNNAFRAKAPASNSMLPSSRARLTMVKGAKTRLEVENVVIIGSGPAGYTSAIYCGRANLKPVLFEGLRSGPPGGQLMSTTDVENFPGFPDGITGPQLMANMRAQSERWGAELETEDVEEIDLSTTPFTVKSSSSTLRANTIIVATGATAKRLDLPSENDYWSRGISACAICDGAAPIFKDQPLGVIGGGDSAVEEAVYLTKYASKVHLFVRGSTLRASKAMQDRALMNPKVTVHFNTVVEDVFGSGVNGGAASAEEEGQGSPLQGCVMKHTETGALERVPLRGIFYAIGHTPNTALFRDQIKLDRAGYIVTKPGTPETSKAGVFAAGDVQDLYWRQAVTAAGSGCTAALAAERYLAANGLIQEVAQDPQPATKPLEKRAEVVAEEDSKTFDIQATVHRGSYALRRLYHESQRPVVVKFAAKDCGPCRSLNPILKRVLNDFEGQIHFVEIDIGESPEIAESAGITGTPTVQIFKRKELLDTIKGVQMKSEYARRLQVAVEARVGV